MSLMLLTVFLKYYMRFTVDTCVRFLKVNSENVDGFG